MFNWVTKMVEKVLDKAVNILCAITAWTQKYFSTLYRKKNVEVLQEKQEAEFLALEKGVREEWCTNFPKMSHTYDYKPNMYKLDYKCEQSAKKKKSKKTKKSKKKKTRKSK